MCDCKKLILKAEVKGPGKESFTHFKVYQDCKGNLSYYMGKPTSTYGGAISNMQLKMDLPDVTAEIPTQKPEEMRKYFKKILSSGVMTVGEIKTF